MKTMPFLILLIGLPLFPLKLSGQSDTLNQKINGMKQGYWIVYGRDFPNKGYPDNGKIEEGPYLDDRKHGFWIKYFDDGASPRLKGNYRNGRPYGEFEKFHRNGVSAQKGNYQNKKMVGDFEIRNEDNVVTQRKTFNKDGKEDGKVEFFYDDGTRQMVVNKKDGVSTGEGVWYYPNGDVKKVVKYGENGEVLSTEEKDRVNPPKGEESNSGSGGPPGNKGIRKDGKPFERDGYNKLYNDNDEIWMDGKFKNGKFWEGKLYVYDSDGILLKIEVWKEGKYHSDGQLD